MNKHLTTVLAALAATALATGAGHAANLVQNGGFEAGTFTDNTGGAGYEQIGAGGTDLAHWTVGNSLAWGLSPIDTAPHSGRGYVDFTGYGTNHPDYGVLSQALATQAGTVYAFSVYAANNGGVGRIEVYVDGAPVALTGAYGLFGDPSTVTWGLLTGSFTATDSSTELRIAGASSTPTFTIGIDDVSVSIASEVPEPSTWMLLLVGLTGLGGALRRARRVPI